MTSRMPSLRRAGQAGTNLEDSADKKSQLPQLTLTPRSNAVGRNVSSLPISSPTRPRMSSLGNDKMSMPPPSAPISRSQSIRSRAIPQASSSSSSSSTARSGIVAPSRSLSTRAPTSSSTSSISQPPTQRAAQHSRSSSTNETGDSALKRTSSVSTRHLRSQSSTTAKSRLATSTTPPTTPPSVKTNSDPVKPAVRRIARPVPSSAQPTLSAAQSRPAFNTLQQHYSPAKQTLPKPPVPTSRLAPSAEDKAVHSGAAFETIKLQSELLYISTLHETAEPNLRGYEKSAYKALEKEFRATQQQARDVRNEEHGIQEQANLAALAGWLGLSQGKHAHIGQEAAEAIQSLSNCFNEMNMLSVAESKYSMLVQTFSTWADEAAQASSAHLFSGPLPQDWHHLHASISQRLRLIEREVEMLPLLPTASDSDTETESSLAVMMSCVRSLIKGTKEELEAMLKLEREVVSTEKQRVGSAVSGLDLETLVQTSEEWTPAWGTAI